MLKSRSKIFLSSSKCCLVTALKAGRRCSSCAQPLAAAADWKYCRTGWNKPRMAVTDRQMQSFPRLSDYPHEQTHLHNEMHLERLEWWKQSFSILTTPKGSAEAELSRDQAQSLPQAQDPAGRCCQCQGHNSKPKQLPGMQCHQDSWIQQPREPSRNSPHSVRAQNEVAGIAHVLLAGLSLHTDREDSCTAFQPGLLK